MGEFDIPDGLFEVQDLVAAARQIGPRYFSGQSYISISDWITDNGLDLIQKAMRNFQERTKEKP